MTETIKEYQRIEQFHWREKAKKCPCCNPNNAVCFLLGKPCAFKICPFHYWLAQLQ